MDISIWKSPDIKIPVTFSFPDSTGQVGNASYHLASDEYGQLNGKIFFWNVEEGSPVKGTFKLATEDGQQFEGEFEAEWQNQVVFCG